MAEAPATTKLLELAARHFDAILPAEQKLFDAAAHGTEADCTRLPKKDRRIRAECLCWLCTNPDASAQVTYSGISLLGAEIDGKVNLERAKISFPLRTSQCEFKEAINLTNSHLVSLDLANTSIQDLYANNSKIEENVLLCQGFKAGREVDLTGATIGGWLVCDGGEFINKAEQPAPALNASAANIDGQVLLRRGFKAEGEVALNDATIGGSLVCMDAEFNGTGGKIALNANSAKIGERVMLCRLKAEGAVDLSAATIGHWLVCNDGEFINRGEPFALAAISAKIGGQVMLGRLKAEGGVSFTGAKIGGELRCDGGEFISNGETPALSACSARIEGAVMLGRLKVDGGVNFAGAKIGGELRCDGGEFISNGETPALNACSARIEGAVILGRLKAEGGVDLTGATIGGQLHCDGGEFISNGERRALNACSAKIGGDAMFYSGFSAEGGVSLRGARIGGSLICSGNQFTGNDDVLGLAASFAHIDDDVVFGNGLSVKGGVALQRANVGGSIRCADCSILVSNGKFPALNASSAQIGGDVLFDQGFCAEGGAELVGTKICGFLACARSKFITKGASPAFAASHAQIDDHVSFGDDFCAEGQVQFVRSKMGGDLYFCGNFIIKGGVSLVGTRIDGCLNCSRGHFIGIGEAPALAADNIEIKNSAYFHDGIVAKGKVQFTSASVDGGFEWRDVKSPETATLDLRSAKAGSLFNDQNSWPDEGKLFINDFVYDRIDDEAFPNAKMQVRWLRRQARDWFSTQPYEQLADVLRKRGLKDDARKVMVKKNKAYAAHLRDRAFAQKNTQESWMPPLPRPLNCLLVALKLLFSAWLWYGFFGKIIGYGYRPWRAFWISLTVIGIGCWVFWGGYRHGLITPTDDKAYVVEKNGKRHLSELYPKFDSFVYSLESFVPLVKLGISDHWAPNANRSLRIGSASFPKAGSLLRGYLWFHIIAGWVLGSLWVGAITGLAKT